MWIVTDEGLVYNADKFLYFGVIGGIAVDSEQSSDCNIIKTSERHYVYAALGDECDTTYRISGFYDSHAEAQAVLNRLIRSIELGDKVFRFKEDRIKGYDK